MSTETLELSVTDYRRENLRRYIDSNGGPTAVAKRLGYTNGSYLVQMVGPNPSRPISEKNARNFEFKLGLPAGTLDREVPMDFAPSPAAPARFSARLPESAPVVQDRAATYGTAMDAVHLANIIGVLAQVCKEQSVELPTGKFADVLALTVADAGAHGGQVREDFVKTLVRLTK